MPLTSQSVHDLLAAFRSANPTPGGGSAAALSGAIGASLLAMAAALPKPAAVSAEDVARLKAAAGRCADLALELESLVDRDSEAYDLVVSAYRLPKAKEDEKALRTKSIQEALRAAIDVPLAVMRASAAAIDEGDTVRTLSNPNASSDVQVGLELLRAARTGAKLNVEINLGGVKDAAYAEAVRLEVARLQHTSTSD